MSWTFIWQLLLSSAKDLLICRDVTGTTDVHTHYFGATFTVTANSQEQHFWDACTMTTVYRTGHGHQIRKQYLQRVSYRFCPTWIFYCPSHNVDFLNWFFSQIAINFAFTWRITRRKCAFVTQCLCAFVRLFFVLLIVKKRAVCAFVLRPCGRHWRGCAWTLSIAENNAFRPMDRDCRGS